MTYRSLLQMPATLETDDKNPEYYKNRKLIDNEYKDWKQKINAEQRRRKKLIENNETLIKSYTSKITKIKKEKIININKVKEEIAYEKQKTDEFLKDVNTTIRNYKISLIKNISNSQEKKHIRVLMETRIDHKNKIITMHKETMEDKKKEIENINNETINKIKDIQDSINEIQENIIEDKKELENFNDELEKITKDREDERVNRRWRRTKEGREILREIERDRDKERDDELERDRSELAKRIKSERLQTHSSGERKKIRQKNLNKEYYMKKDEDFKLNFGKKDGEQKYKKPDNIFINK